MSLEIQRYDSIEQVPCDSWDSIAPKKYICLETGHLKAIERSGINELQPYYMLASHNGTSGGIAYFCVIDFDLSSISKDISSTTRDTIKFWNPDFLNMRMLECGLISGLGETIAAKDEIFPTFLPLAIQEMEHVAKTTETDLILIRDIPYQKYSLYKKVLEECGFIPVLGFPTTIMELRWNTFEDYLNSLKNKTRLNIKNRMNKLDDEEISIELIQDFGVYADRLEYLWNQVDQNTGEYDHEKLSARYFKEINQCLPDKSHIIAIKSHGKIIAFGLSLIGNQEYFGAHAGIDYKYNKQYELYFNLHLLTLEEAIKRGAKFLNIGITAYDFKLLMGLELQHLVYFVKYAAQPHLTPALVKMLQDAIKQPENFHRPFKNQDISKRVQVTDLNRELFGLKIGNKKDVFSKAYNFVRSDAARLSELYPYFPSFNSAQTATVQYQGKPVIMMGSNSYLGLGSHPEVRAAAKDAIDKYGTGCSGSPLLNGTLDIHADLARSLADFMQKEDAILFSTGYQTNLGVIHALVGRHDVVILDTRDHASIHDGSKFSYADVVRFKHDNMESLEKALQKYPDKGKLVVVDSVFSMEGTIVNLPAVVELVKKYNARLMLDEAHGIGVLGPWGKGVAEHFGLLDQVDIIMGTFSKSFAAVGGFVASDAKIIDYLRHVSRSHIFSASLPPPVVATARKALDIIIREPERRKNALENAKFMANSLQKLGYDTAYHGTAIVPVYCRDELLTLGLFKKLFNEGVYTNPVVSPAVPPGQELLRTSYMATQTKENLSRALKIFKKVRTPYFPKGVRKEQVEHREPVSDSHLVLVNE